MVVRDVGEVGGLKLDSVDVVVVVSAALAVEGAEWRLGEIGDMTGRRGYEEGGDRGGNVGAGLAGEEAACDLCLFSCGGECGEMGLSSVGDVRDGRRGSGGIEIAGDDRRFSWFRRFL